MNTVDKIMFSDAVVRCEQYVEQIVGEGWHAWQKPAEQAAMRPYEPLATFAWPDRGEVMIAWYWPRAGRILICEPDLYGADDEDTWHIVERYGQGRTLTQPATRFAQEFGAEVLERIFEERSRPEDVH